MSATFSSQIAPVIGVSEGRFRLVGTVVANGDDIRITDSSNTIRSQVADIVDRSKSISLSGQAIEHAIAGLDNLGAHLGIDNRTGTFEVIGQLQRLGDAPTTPYRIYVDGRATVPAGADLIGLRVDSARVLSEPTPTSGGFIED